MQENRSFDHDVPRLHGRDVDRAPRHATNPHLPALTNRDVNADPMLAFFDFASPPFMRPPRLPKAKNDPDRSDCS